MEGPPPVALYSLKWNNHPAHFSQGLKSLLENDFLKDVHICSSTGEHVRAHKLVLALSSPYFKELFELEPYIPDSATIILLPHVRHEDLVNIIKFIYTGETRVRQQDLKRFLETCNDLKLSINAGKLGLGDNNQQKKQEQAQLRPKPVKTSPPPPPPLRSITKPLPPLLTPKQFRKSVNNVPDGPESSPLYGIDVSSFCETELQVGGDEAEDQQDCSSATSRQGHHGIDPNYPNDTMTSVNSSHGDQEEEEEEEERAQSPNKKIKREVAVERVEKNGGNGYKMEYPQNQKMVDDDGSESDSMNDGGFDANEYLEPEGTTGACGADDSVNIQEFEDGGIDQVSPDHDNGKKQRSLGSRSFAGKSVTVCDICGAKFHRKDSYRRHRKSHGAHQYRCDECGRGFYRRDLFNRHLESQHGKPKVL